jgi:hypothetical protein
MIRWLSLILLAVFSIGCGARMATVSTEKTAYAVRSGFLGTNMYYCSAANPQQPVCKKVDER